MEDSIKISCPECGAVLSVRNQIGIESKSVTCPVCKKRSPYVRFKQIVDRGEETQVSCILSNNNTPGRIVVLSTNTPFQLREGKNVIGRQATGSAAQIQIPCVNRRMSREHLVIEVKNEHGQGLVHYLSLTKQQVNPTYVGSVLLEYGDKIVLQHNDVIKLPDLEVRFEIPDEAGTELNSR